MQNSNEKVKVKDKLKEIIISQMGYDEDIMFEKDGFSLEQIAYDSVKFVELIVQIEDAFHVVFRDEDLELEKLLVFKELERLLEKYVNDNIREEVMKGE